MILMSYAGFSVPQSPESRLDTGEIPSSSADSVVESPDPSEISGGHVEKTVIAEASNYSDPEDQVENISDRLDLISNAEESCSETDSGMQSGPAKKLGFSEIMELVTKGLPIPGVEALDIKPTGTELTESTQNRVKKPWE